MEKTDLQIGNDIKALSIVFLADLFLNSLFERGVAYGGGVCLVGVLKNCKAE